LFKKSALIMLTFVFAMSISLGIVGAKGNDKEEVKEYNLNDRVVKVNIYKEAQGKISDDSIKELIERHPKAGMINIHNVTEPQASKEDDSIQGCGYYNPCVGSEYTVTSKTKTSYDNMGSSKFIISVPKGSTKSLSSSTTKSTNTSVSGGTSGMNTEVKSQLNWGVSKSYSTSITWSGPPESSKYNSRSYYWAGKYDYGNWRGREDIYSEGEIYETKYYNGNFSEYVRYVEYSVDESY
jgi:hypothetical protein